MRKDANLLLIHGDISTSTQDASDGLKKLPKFSNKNVTISRLGIEQNFPIPTKKK